MNDISNTFILNGFEPPKKCDHTIGIEYQRSGLDGDLFGSPWTLNHENIDWTRPHSEPYQPVHVELFAYCPNCGKKLHTKATTEKNGRFFTTTFTTANP